MFLLASPLIYIIIFVPNNINENSNKRAKTELRFQIGLEGE
jgi:hypothetical protein